jgi:hypothetical protein
MRSLRFDLLHQGIFKIIINQPIEKLIVPRLSSPEPVSVMNRGFDLFIP